MRDYCDQAQNKISTLGNDARFLEVECVVLSCGFTFTNSYDWNSKVKKQKIADYIENMRIAECSLNKHCDVN